MKPSDSVMSDVLSSVASDWLHSESFRSSIRVLSEWRQSSTGFSELCQVLEPTSPSGAARAHSRLACVFWSCAAVADGIAPPLVWTCPPCFPRRREQNSPAKRPRRPVKPAHRWVLPSVTGAADTDERYCGGQSRVRSGFPSVSVRVLGELSLIWRKQWVNSRSGRER